MVVMSAAIKGRVPETGLLIIAPFGTGLDNDQKIQLHPIAESEKEPKFETSEFFPDKGQFQVSDSKQVSSKHHGKISTYVKHRKLKALWRKLNCRKIFRMTKY